MEKPINNAKAGSVVKSVGGRNPAQAQAGNLPHFVTPKPKDPPRK